MIETLLCMAAMAAAEPASGTDIVKAAEAPLRFDLDAAVWLVRLKGQGSNGGDTLQFGEDASDSLGLGNLEGLFRGELTVSKNPWAVRIMGTHGSWNGTTTLGPGMSTTWGGQPLTAGVDYAASFDMSWFAMEGHWYPITWLGDGRRDTLDPVDLNFGPHIGVSWIDIQQSVGSVSNAGVWWTGYVGAELMLDVDLKPFTSLLHSMSIGVGGSVGGAVSDGGLFYKVRGGLTLHITQQMSATAGYRLMEFKNLKDGDWDISPSFPGFFIALNVTF